MILLAIGSDLMKTFKFAYLILFCLLKLFFPAFFFFPFLLFGHPQGSLIFGHTRSAWVTLMLHSQFYTV